MLRQLRFCDVILLLGTVTPEIELEYRIAGQGRVVHDVSCRLMPCLIYFKGVFVSAYGKVAISIIAVCGLVYSGRGQISGSHIVKCEQE